MKSILHKVRSTSHPARCYSRRACSASAPDKISPHQYCSDILDSSTIRKKSFDVDQNAIKPKQSQLQFPTWIEEDVMVKDNISCDLLPLPASSTVSVPEFQSGQPQKPKKTTDAAVMQSEARRIFQLGTRRARKKKGADKDIANDAASVACSAAREQRSSEADILDRRRQPREAVLHVSSDAAVSNDAAIAACLEAMEQGSPQAAILDRPRQLRHAARHVSSKAAVSSDAAIAACLGAIEPGSHEDNTLGRLRARDGEVSNDAAIAACLEAMEQGSSRADTLERPRQPGDAAQHVSSTAEASSDAAIAALLEAMEQGSSQADTLNRCNQPRDVDLLHSSSAEVSNDAAIAMCLEAMERGSSPQGVDFLNVDAVPAASSNAGVASDPGTAVRFAAITHGTVEDVSEQSAEVASNCSSTSEEDECVVCLDLQSSVCLIPCGHTCLCQPCADNLVQPRTCPMCRMPIEQVVQTVGRRR